MKQAWQARKRGIYQKASVLKRVCNFVRILIYFSSTSNSSRKVALNLTVEQETRQKAARRKMETVLTPLPADCKPACICLAKIDKEIRYLGSGCFFSCRRQKKVQSCTQESLSHQGSFICPVDKLTQIQKMVARMMDGKRVKLKCNAGVAITSYCYSVPLSEERAPMKMRQIGSCCRCSVLFQILNVQTQGEKPPQQSKVRLIFDKLANKNTGYGNARSIWLSRKP